MRKQRQQDPTGQKGNRLKGRRGLRRRLKKAEREVKTLFKTIPRTRRQITKLQNRSAVIPVYDYQITPEELEILNRRVAGVLDAELLQTSTDRLPPNWWWASVVELPYRQGTAEEIVNFNQLLTAEIIEIRRQRGIPTQRLEIASVLLSAEYQTAARTVYAANFEVIKTLSDRTADQVNQMINLGIQAGNTPTKIAEMISERFDVARSSADRIANTEVNKAYNDARLNAVDVAAKQTGLRAGVIHLSALMPTTRETHGDRHGNAYTTAQQRQWWNSNANRINCHCSTTTVLIDNKGRVIDTELQQEIKAERSFFDD